MHKALIVHISATCTDSLSSCPSNFFLSSVCRPTKN